GGDLRLWGEVSDLLVEVANPDSGCWLLEQREVKIISVHQDGALRLFVAALPGGIKTAFFGSSPSEQPGLSGDLNGRGLRLGILVSRFNSFITDRLLAGAVDALRRTGVSERDIIVVRVPGSF